MTISQAQIAVFTAPYTVGVLETDLPSPGPNEVLVQSLFSGISHGTEMNVYRGKAPQWSKIFDPKLRLFLPGEQAGSGSPARGYWKPSDTHWGYPLAYGYQNVGRIVTVGSGVTGLQEGELVFSYEPHQTAYIAPAPSLIRLPHLPKPEYGVVYSNINTAYNGVLDSDIRLDDTVVIFGQGLIGLLVLQFVKRTAAKQVIVVDTLAQRRDMSLRLGADHALDPDSLDVARFVRELTDGRGADVVIEVTGSYAALHEAIRTAAPNTTVTALSWYGGTGESLRLSDEFHHNRITLKCSQVGGIGPDISATHSLDRRMQNVLDSFHYLQLDALLTDCVPFSDVSTAYEKVDRHAEEVIQVYLRY